MASWTCSACERRFARTNQGHECAPAMTIEEYFETGPAHERPIFEAVAGHLRSLGDVHVEPVSVGIFFKATGKICELRPKTRWSALSFAVPRRLDDPRVSRKPIAQGQRWWHVVNLRTPADYDERVREWLEEAYAAAE